MAMRRSERTIWMVDEAELPGPWRRLLGKVRGGRARVIIREAGAPVAAMVSADDLERLAQFEAQRAERFKTLEEIGDAFKDVPVGELEREVARAIAEVRDEHRQRRQDAAATP